MAQTSKLNQLTTIVPHHIETSLFALLINWLISMWWETLDVNGLKNDQNMVYENSIQKKHNVHEPINAQCSQSYRNQFPCDGEKWALIGKFRDNNFRKNVFFICSTFFSFRLSWWNDKVTYGIRGIVQTPSHRWKIGWKEDEYISKCESMYELIWWSMRVADIWKCQCTISGAR